MKKIAASMAVLLLTAACGSQEPARVIYKNGDENTKMLASLEGKAGGLSFFPRWNDGKVEFAKGDLTQSDQYQTKVALTSGAPTYSQRTVHQAPATRVQVSELPPVSNESAAQSAANEYEGKITFASVEHLPSAIYQPQYTPSAR